MEYPFKDLLPLDEVLEREGYYKDWTHLDPEVFYSLTQISEYIKTKGYGVDVRLLISQLAEHFGLKSTQIIDLANLLQDKFDNLEGVTQSFTNNINSLVAQMEAEKNAVIANATVDSEVILARGGKATLGQRLDETTAQNEIKTLSYTKYGDLWFPPGYRSIIRSKIHFNLFRDFDGLVKHDYDFDQQINRYTKIYLRKHDSSNANDGLTPQTPLTTLEPAVNKAIDLDEPVSFIFMDKFAEYSANELQQFGRLSKDYNLSSSNEKGSIFGAGVRSSFNWQRDGELFKTSRSATIEVFDYNKRKANGDLKGFKKVNTISECRNVYMSFYTDGTSVWINYDIESGVSREIGLNLLVRQEYSLDFSGRKVNMNKLSFLGVGKTEGSLNALKVVGDSDSEVYINEGIFRNASLNGLATINVGNVFVFDSVATGNGVDAFNYHGQGSEFVFEYNAYGSDGGTPEQSSSNVTTAHDGLMIIRVGTIGENCRGPLLADVNGCISINYDVRMYNSLLPSGKSKAAFYGSDSGADSPGEMWLINCEGGGDDTYTLYYPDLPNSKSVKVINLKGLDIEEGTRVEYIH